MAKFVVGDRVRCIRVDDFNGAVGKVIDIIEVFDDEHFDVLVEVEFDYPYPTVFGDEIKTWCKSENLFVLEEKVRAGQS
tara:strand:+ start:136 stop:372 length:237 start_codon:yes stop_codon:yes gene_type:complete